MLLTSHGGGWVGGKGRREPQQGEASRMEAESHRHSQLGCLYLDGPICTMGLHSFVQQMFTRQALS